MTEKSEEKVLKSVSMKTHLNDVVKRGRGRPKGSKNKLRSFASVEALAPKRGRGRPKGAKNKPKPPQPEGGTLLVKHKHKDPTRKRGRPRKNPIPQEEAPENKVIETTPADSLDDHPLLCAVKWIEKNMHPTEVDYYRRRASRNGVPLHCAMVSDILGFFNVQNAEICKQIKKNNFIVSNSNGLPN